MVGREGLCSFGGEHEGEIYEVVNEGLDCVEDLGVEIGEGV